MTETEPDIAALARRRQNRRLRRLVGILLLGGPLCALIVLVTELNQHDHSLGDVHWAGWLVVGVIAVVPAAMAGLMIWLRRRGVSRYQPLLVGGVDRERSRSIRDAIKEGRPVEARDQAIAVELTQRTVQQRWIVYGTAFWLLFALVNEVLGHHFGFPQALIVVGAAGSFTSLPFSFRDIRRARRWLRDNEHDADN